MCINTNCLITSVFMEIKGFTFKNCLTAHNKSSPFLNWALGKIVLNHEKIGNLLFNKIIKIGEFIKLI